MDSSHLANHRFVLWLSIITVLTSLVTKNVFADGKFYPQKTYKATPSIPTQRALIVYSDGIEKLIIESTFEGQGKEFGWILPVPSKPIEFKAVTPSLIKTLSLNLQPHITHTQPNTVSLFVFAIFVTILCLIHLFGIRGLLKQFLIILVGIGVVFILFVPTLQSTASSQGKSLRSSVKVSNVETIGNYEVVVLEAEDTNNLDVWLTENGYVGLAPADKKIVSNYISEHWVFIAARLRTEKDGFSSPHPIEVNFKTPRCVYPMRLTSTVGDNVYLELFVVAKEQANHDLLDLEVADKYKSGKVQLPRNDRQSQFGFLGQTFNQNIGHPDGKRYIWDECFVTKLAAVLSPQQMSEDIYIRFETNKPYIKDYYSRKGACQTALLYGLNGWWIMLLALVIYDSYKFKGKGRHRLKQIFAEFLLPAAIVSISGIAITYAVLPKIEIKQPTSLPSFLFRHRVHQDFYEITNRIASQYDYFTGMSRDAIAGCVAGYLKQEQVNNPFTDESIQYEDSPGNYIILEDDRGVVFRAYDEQGFSDDFILTLESDEEKGG